MVDIGGANGAGNTANLMISKEDLISASTFADSYFLNVNSSIISLKDSINNFVEQQKLSWTGEDVNKVRNVLMRTIEQLNKFSEYLNNMNNEIKNGNTMLIDYMADSEYLATQNISECLAKISLLMNRIRALESNISAANNKYYSAMKLSALPGASGSAVSAYRYIENVNTWRSEINNYYAEIEKLKKLIDRLQHLPEKDNQAAHKITSVYESCSLQKFSEKDELLYG